MNGKGPGTVIVSCVSHTEPYHVHPHKLVGDNCKSGVAIFRLQPGQTQVEYVGFFFCVTNFRIMCVKFLSFLFIVEFQAYQSSSRKKPKSISHSTNWRAKTSIHLIVLYFIFRFFFNLIDLILISFNSQRGFRSRSRENRLVKAALVFSNLLAHVG